MQVYSEFSFRYLQEKLLLSQTLREERPNTCDARSPDKINAINTLATPWGEASVAPDPHIHQGRGGEDLTRGIPTKT